MERERWGSRSSERHIRIVNSVPPLRHPVKVLRCEGRATVFVGEEDSIQGRSRTEGRPARRFPGRRG